MISGKEQIIIQKLQNLIILLFILVFDLYLELTTAIVLNFPVSGLSIRNSKAYI
jgi:hypothetical protein